MCIPEMKIILIFWLWERMSFWCIYLQHTLTLFLNRPKLYVKCGIHVVYIITPPIPSKYWDKAPGFTECGGKQCYECTTDSNMKAIAAHYYINGEISTVGDTVAILSGNLQWVDAFECTTLILVRVRYIMWSYLVKDFWSRIVPM